MVHSEVRLPRTDQTPLTFMTNSNADSLIDLCGIRLYTKVRIRKIGTDNEPIDLPTGEKVVPYNGFMFTMFQDCEVIISLIILWHTLYVRTILGLSELRARRQHSEHVSNTVLPKNAHFF